MMHILQVIPGRMTLLITVFLVLINIFNTIQTNSPKVISFQVVCHDLTIAPSWLQADGLTAIEAWLIACIVFVFAALVEYTGILLKMKMRKLTGTKRKKDNYAITDLAFFVFFPILFTIFNVLYWTSICWKRLEEQEKYNLWLVKTKQKHTLYILVTIKQISISSYYIYNTITINMPVLLKFILYLINEVITTHK